MLMIMLMVFVLALFVGVEVIGRVPRTLHTPLMSGSNAISGITIIGALWATSATGSGLDGVLATIALACATVNVVGGFAVTHRMLEMFDRSKKQ
jgi:NAD(P) transhydrogenase subunit alpha